jgi:hypothetical protein
MPCNDVTEVLRLEIGRGDRLKNYSFQKKTCGGAVGAESLLLSRIEGRTVAEFLESHADTFIDFDEPAGEVERYLELKHFFAVRAALEVVTGSAPGGVGSACTIAEIGFDGDTMIIEAEILVAIVAEKIKSCGHCGGG